MISKSIFKYLITALAAITILSCEQISNLAEKKQSTLDTDYYEMDFLLKATTGLKLQILSEELFQNQIDPVLNQSGISYEKISSITVKEASVSILEANNYTDFSVLRFIELTIYNDSLGESKIAWSDPVPNGQSTVSLDHTDDNLLPYFSSDNFILTSLGYLKERVYEDVKLHARVKFEVKGEF